MALRRIAAVVISCWFATAQAADTDAHRGQNIEEEMIVTGHLEETIPLELEAYGNRLAVITAADLELGGFDDLSQSLQMLVPGLYLAPRNGAFDYMNCSLQGSRCQDILWLIDGVRINNRLYNSTSPLDTVPAHMVERIEVLYGGQGIFYGTQSVAGVVNVVTRGFSRAPEGSIGFGVDGNDGVHLSADYSATFGGHQLVLYGSRDEADGFQPFRDRDYQPSSTDRERGYEVENFGLKYGHAFGSTSRLTLHYQHTDNEVERPAPDRRARAFNQRNEDLVTLKWDQRFGEDVELYVKGYYHYWDSYWTQLDNELDANGALTGNVIVQSDHEFWGYDDYGVTAVTRIRTDRGLEYALGYDHQRFSGEDQVLLIADRTEHVNAVFAQVRTAPSLLERTRLALGVRHNRPSGEGDITVWNLSGRHDFDSDLYLRGSAGTSFRLPDAFQLYGNDPCCTLGNPDLEGEKSRNVALALGGAWRLADSLRWELIAFHREVDDLIGSENGVRVNTDDTVGFTGLELSTEWALTPSWSFGIDYLVTEAEEEGSDVQIDEVPESVLKLNARYDGAGDRLELMLALVRIGDLYATLGNGIGRREHGNYTVADLSAAYRLGGEARHRIALRFENAFDEDYGSSLGTAFTDIGANPYAYTNLGTPRTLHASYTFSF